jgi:hypothetical protein
MLGQVPGDVLVHGDDVLNAVITARDPGLVGHDCDRKAGTVERSDSVRGPVYELNPIDGSYISVVNDDRAVTVEENARPDIQRGPSGDDFYLSGVRKHYVTSPSFPRAGA